MKRKTTSKFYSVIISRLMMITLLSLLTTLAYAQGFPELMYFKFDTLVGGKTFNEASSATRAGSDSAAVVGLTIGGTGQFGAALNGLAGATATNNVNPAWTGTHTGSWTISFWCNPPTPPTTRYYFGNSTGNGTFRCFIGGAASGIRLTGGVPTMTLDMPAFTPATTNGSVITYVYDQTAGTVSGYINGVFQASQSPGASYPLVGANFWIGSQGTSIEGPMDEFRMYNRALSASEVLSAYNVTLFNTPCTTPPVAGMLVPNTAIACPSVPFSISVSGSSMGSGLSYQWESSTIDSAGPYTTLVNDTNAGITTSQALTTWYRRITTCNSVSETSAAIKMFTPTITLSGAYTINKNIPASSTNYTSLTDFATEISCVGVTGPVTVDIIAGTGPYNGGAVFGNIPGISSTNTLTIHGHNNMITGMSSPLLSFAGTSYTSVDSLNIVADSGFGGFGVHVGNQAHHITFNANMIDVGQTSTSTSNAGFVVSGANNAATTAGNNAQFITFTNNEIIGGYYSATFTGNSSYLNNSGHLIQNNTFRDFYVYGLYIVNADTVTVVSNNIHRMNRSSLSTFYGIYMSTCRNTKILSNRIHDAGTGSYTAYPVYLTGSANTVGNETEFINNSIYNIPTTGTIYGMYLLGTRDRVNLYHNTIALDMSGNAGTVRGLFMSTSPTNHDIKNNIFSINNATAGAKYCIYITTAAATMVSNYNVYFIDTTIATNNLGYSGAARKGLTAWQTATSQDANSSNADPVFVSNTALPLSLNIDNIGTPIATVTTDQTGASRSGTPDPGALEFTGLAGDISIEKGELIRSGDCYSMFDTVNIYIHNTIGTTIDFSIDPLTVVWKTSGPVNTTDSFIVTSGTLAPGASQKLTASNVNMSAAGDYTLNAYLKPNAVNLSAGTDTLAPVQFNVKPILSVSPKTITVNGPADTVVLKASSPLFPGGGAFFSEIAHYKVATGAPIGGWPAYLTADDYVEITGVPNSDLAGFIMEEWSTTAMTHSVTFPAGTLFSPNGTMILATGQLGSSTPSPANFYYHTGNTVTHSSTGVGGYILKNNSGTIIDAVAYGTFTFPAASGVTVADWSGNTPAVSSSGNTLNAPDNNTNTCWVNSGTVAQTPNVLNAGITAPLPGSLTGFDWVYMGSSISTSPNVTVGPYSTPGIYVYVAQYFNTCGMFYDTVYVTASSTVPVKLTSFTATKENTNVNLHWNTASEVNNNHFEIERSENGKDFNAIGRVKGNGTTGRPNRYAYIDVNATRIAANVLYYRLKQVDNDGSFTYSKTEVVRLSDVRISGLTTRPNPSNGVFTISAELESTSAVTKTVVNIMGKTVLNQTVNPVIGTNMFDMQLQLPNGVYMLLFEQNGETSTQKFVIEQ